MAFKRTAGRFFGHCGREDSAGGARGEGIDVGCLNFVDLWPFPYDKAKTALNKGKRFFMVEQNSTAQLGHLIKEQVGFSFSEAILKYDGRPFYPNEIVESFKQYER